MTGLGRLTTIAVTVVTVCGDLGGQAPAVAPPAAPQVDLAMDAGSLEDLFHRADAAPASWSMPTLDRTFVDGVIERVPIYQPPGEAPLPFARLRAVSKDGLREMRLVHWHDSVKPRTDLVYLSEREAASGPHDGSRFRLTRMGLPASAEPCTLPADPDDAPRVDPFGADGVFRSARVQLPPRLVRVLFVPTDVFIREASQPDLRQPEHVLKVLWLALVNLNAAAGFLHRELNIELAPVLSRKIVSTGPSWNNADAPGNFVLIRNAIDKFCVRDCTYDLGHALVGTNQRGWGRLSKACHPVERSAGYSPNGNIVVIAHELAHQLGANHTFNKGEAWHPQAAVEPSDGVTMMVHQISRYYLHAWSAGEILEYLRTPGCGAFGTVGATTNEAPTFTGPPARLTVPPGTPIRIVLQASDADHDRLRLRCEGIDRAAQEGAVPPVLGSSIDVVDGAVVMPRLTDVLEGKAPASASGHALRVACTARDHRGGMAIAQLPVDISGADPFAVQVKAEDPRAKPVTVTWNDPGRTVAEVSVRGVRLQLVDQQGTTVPWVSVADGGTHQAALPRNLAAGRWRVWAQPISRPFFAVSEAFTVP